MSTAVMFDDEELAMLAVRVARSLAALVEEHGETADQTVDDALHVERRLYLGDCA